MSDIAIRVENLGKSYQIAHSGGRSGYKTLQEDILRWLKHPFSKIDTPAIRETFWALRDVSFEVKHGEVLGIIGHNGAGKSTLLKILSRITKPTTGRADIYGRIGSLLEVGTGFHPELTGRENIFLNGAVLGMTRRDIQKHFDEIVAFAEVEQFLDTPVKRYSSGMYMRLAFAVAAHLEPEVLVVDEVLAVGDADFQKKCLGKMSEVAKDGRTVLFVSHNMGAMQQLCNTGILLNRGKIQFTGDMKATITEYLKAAADLTQGNTLRERIDRKGEGRLKFTGVSIVDEKGTALEHILSGQNVYFRLYYEAEYELRNASVFASFNVASPEGILLTNLNSKVTGDTNLPIYHSGYFECHWPRFNLRSGTYTCNLFCSINDVIEDWLQSAFQIYVDDGNFYDTSSLPDRSQGDVLVNHSWQSIGLSASEDTKTATISPSQLSELS